VITPSELWIAAERLVSGLVEPDTEFTRRLAVSRLYYAVFHGLQSSSVGRALPRPAATDGSL